nr:hypothetical protein CFP56_31815 [Quercus suber]
MQIDTKPQLASIPRTPSIPMISASQQNSQTPSGPGRPPILSFQHVSNISNAAPGPIPATTPLVVRQDNNGVQWIAFEYSRDRVKMEYTIRCDVEAVNVEELDQDFKSANCVYPRACCSKDQYKGNRLHYESECNAVGWALAQLNPNLREKRGLIQRAVDSWRNSNQDPRLRSRRVRRMAKVHTRKGQVGVPGPPGSHGPATAGSHPTQAGSENDTTPAHHHQRPQPQQRSDDSPSPPSSARYTHNSGQTYPRQPMTEGSSTMPPTHNEMDLHSQTPRALAPPATAAADDDSETQRALFGDIPEHKRRKFILVDDVQRGTRVRVRVMLLDQVKLDDMPDAHLRTNAVYPRSYYPRQMRRSPRGRATLATTADQTRDVDADNDENTDDDDSVEGVSDTLPTFGRTLVPVTLLDGSTTDLAVPRMTKRRRAKEVALNELGYRMSWGQARTFNRRTLFLQRSLDAYRSKVRSSMISLASGSQHQQDADAIVQRNVAPHFELRPGRRKWLARADRVSSQLLIIDNSPRGLSQIVWTADGRQQLLVFRTNDQIIYDSWPEKVSSQ